MEPFFLRCETCHARLRVRDERFLGQVQSCPKCGSMVQIIAPAGWLATADSAPAPEPVEIAAAAATSIIGRVVGTMHEHAVLWTASAATALVACGLLGIFAISGGDEVAALPPSSPVVTTPVIEPQVEIPRQSDPVQEQAVMEQVESVPATSIPVRPAPLEDKLAVEEAASPAVETPAIRSEPVAKSEKPRTLMLAPVPEAAGFVSANKIAAQSPEHPAPDYSTVIAAEVAKLDATPPAAEAPARITNVKDQLSVPIESIDLPAMPIGEFVALVSTMAAVPIQLDAKVLGEVGLSSRSTVTVRGDHTTAGKLLASVLKDHQLTCVERDGVLVVVKAKR